MLNKIKVILFRSALDLYTDIYVTDIALHWF